MASKVQQLVLLAALLAVLFHAAECGRVLHEAPAFEANGGDHSTTTATTAADQQQQQQQHEAPADTRADAEYARSLAIRELSVTIDGEAHRSMKPRFWPPPPPLNPYHP